MIRQGKKQSGKGQHIDICQTDVLTSMNVLNIAAVLAHREGKKARPVNLYGENLCYNTFKTSDGKFIALGAVEPKFWRSFCKAVDREDWIPYHLLPYEEGAEATEELKDLFASKTRKEWEDIFENVDTCLTPILTPDETLENQQLKEQMILLVMNNQSKAFYCFRTWYTLI